jgi:hypothetical protein
MRRKDLPHGFATRRTGRRSVAGRRLDGNDVDGSRLYRSNAREQGQLIDRLSRLEALAPGAVNEALNLDQFVLELRDTLLRRERALEKKSIFGSENLQRRVMCGGFHGQKIRRSI